MTKRYLLKHETRVRHQTAVAQVGRHDLVLADPNEEEESFVECEGVKVNDDHFAIATLEDSCWNWWSHGVPGIKLQEKEKQDGFVFHSPSDERDLYMKSRQCMTQRLSSSRCCDKCSSVATWKCLGKGYFGPNACF